METMGLNQDLQGSKKMLFSYAIKWCLLLLDARRVINHRQVKCRNVKPSPFFGWKAHPFILPQLERIKSCVFHAGKIKFYVV